MRFVVADAKVSSKLRGSILRRKTEQPCGKVDYIAVCIASEAMISLIGLPTGVLISMKRTFAEAFTINLKPIHFGNSTHCYRILYRFKQVH